MRPFPAVRPDAAPRDFDIPASDVPITRRSVLTASLAPLLLPTGASATEGSDRFATWCRDRLILSNGVVQREIALPTLEKPIFATLVYRTIATPSRYFTGHDAAFAGQSDEFAFTANGTAYRSSADWMITDVRSLRLGEASGAEVTVAHRDGLDVTVRYLLYPDAPIVRKQLTIRNIGRSDLAIENVEIENFAMEYYWPSTFSWVYSDYGRRKSLAPFTGTMQDSLVALHNPDWGEGIVLGNEAAGVNKFTSAFAGSSHFKTGLAPSNTPYGFRRWLKSGDAMKTPQVFSVVYAGMPRFENVLNGPIADFVRRHLGTRLSRFPIKPSFLYNSWEPFQTAIDDKLIRELATAAAACGVKEFVIDDGWQDNYGDWGVDRTKFPNGLKPVFDHIKSLGMKPGLWVTIGSADRASRVYRQHPEWFAHNSQGQHYSIMPDTSGTKFTACFSTGWRDYIKGVLLRLTQEHGLEYLKLDLAVVTSPYRHDTVEHGCAATDHAGHRDQAESRSTSFDAMWRMFDEYHASNPHVFIDCTFETMGGFQLIDYAMLQHAEGNWLSNFNEPGAANDLRVRNMAWWRSPAMPATALVIGNSKLNDGGALLHLMSLAGTLPILLGDPRLLPSDVRAQCRAFARWFEAMEARHGIMGFRQDLPGFGEPADGAWDGFQRINTDTQSGGIVGVFRHGAAERARTVTVTGLRSKHEYIVREWQGQIVATQTGAALADVGFECILRARHDGQLYEVAASPGKSDG